MIRMGAARVGQLSVQVSDKTRWVQLYCVLNDVFLLAYDKPSDPTPKVTAF